LEEFWIFFGDISYLNMLIPRFTLPIQLSKTKITGPKIKFAHDYLPWWHRRFVILTQFKIWVSRVLFHDLLMVSHPSMQADIITRASSKQKHTVSAQQKQDHVQIMAGTQEAKAEE
jgi:hypothetical protein